MLDAGWVRGRLHYLAVRIPEEIERAELDGPGELEELANELRAVANMVKNGTKRLEAEFAAAKAEAERLKPQRDYSVKLYPWRRRRELG